MKIVDLIPQIYTGLGEIDQQRLKMSIVLQKLNSVLCMNLKKLNISDLNWFMTSFIISVSPEINDYQDFPGDWGRQIHADYSLDRITWYPLDLINVNYLDEIGRGQRPCAGMSDWTPPHLKIRNMPGGATAVQIWYEPDKAAPLNWNAELSDSVRSGFEPGIIAEAAFLCAPFVEGGLPDGVLQVVAYERDQWVQIRNEYIYRPRVTGRVPKRGFTTGIRQGRWR